METEVILTSHMNGLWAYRDFAQMNNMKDGPACKLNPQTLNCMVVNALSLSLPHWLYLEEDNGNYTSVLQQSI